MKNLATPRMQALQSAFQSSCVKDCNGVWFSCAENVLHRNSVNKYVFADAIRNLLEKGRGKHRNIYIVGPGNSAKTFLLKPLLCIYPEHFSNPASSTFSWIGADQASLILLNDYRWHTKKNGGNIDWGVFLNLLEGSECNLPAPMNMYAKHVKITTDVPIVATGPYMIQWYINSPDEIRTQKHEKEDDQMALRWRKFEFTHKFTDADEIKDVPECMACFAKLAMLGKEQ